MTIKIIDTMHEAAEYGNYDDLHLLTPGKLYLGLFSGLVDPYSGEEPKSGPVIGPLTACHANESHIALRFERSEDGAKFFKQHDGEPRHEWHYLARHDGLFFYNGVYYAERSYFIQD